MAKGLFITVEGADGVGKTTQVKFLSKWISARGIDLVITREPGGTQLGEALRDILLAVPKSADNPEMGKAISDETELMLMFAARMQHLVEIIKPALSQGKWVLCDRFTDASYAYQGGGRGIEIERIQHLENWVQQGFEPDITFLLDVPVETGLARTQTRGKSADRFEQEEIEFKNRVRELYLHRAEQFSDRIKLIDATQEIEVVQSNMIGLLDKHLKSHS